MNEDFAASDSAIQEALVVKPDASELVAIKTFCNFEVQKKMAVAAASEALKDLRSKQKDLRVKLTADLATLGTKCAMLSKVDAARIAATLPDMPPYIRLVSANKDASITPEVIQEAIESITAADLLETKESDPKVALKKVVMQNVRRIIRSFTESLKMVPSLQRGLTVYEVAEVSSETADRMAALWAADLAVRDALASKKPPQNPEADAAKTKVEAFFIRTGLVAQRVVVEGQQYRLVRRISVRKQKVGIGKLESMIDEVMIESLPETAQLVRALHIALANVPPESKSSVTLCNVKSE
jgi:hypothetical protein